jgi:hypothetical protein
MPSPLSVTILYNKTNTYGLTDDIQVIERLLKKLQDKLGQMILKPKLLDMREPHIISDIQIHLEIPVFSAIPWSFTNILVVNPEQWSFAYDAYVHSFDMLLFREPISAEEFTKDFEKKGIPTDSIYVVPWCSSLQVKDVDVVDMKEEHSKGFVSFLAGSKSKYEYMKEVVEHWKENDPPLTIYTTRNDFMENLKKMNLSRNISVFCQDLDKSSRFRILSSYPGHLVCSQAEAYSYAASYSEVIGSFTIMNSLPVFTYMYSSNGISWLSNSYQTSDKVRYSIAHTTPSLRQELESAFELFQTTNLSEIRKTKQELSKQRFQTTCEEFFPVLQRIHTLVLQRKPSKGIFHIPPILDYQDCPPISIITPTYNRKEFIDIAFHNLLSTDYPKNKIEWVVIEDNEKTPHMASDKIINFQIQVPEIKIKYIPIEGRMTIGEKRNYAVENASNDIILFMDDDDHYPVTSFRRRVAWLTKGMKRGEIGKARIACCTTLALYDLKKGTSAINVPPFDIPFSQRISEATFTFYKSVWQERPFPKVSLSEGENWILGRENEVIEIPPQQIIVAFSHGKNQSNRRIPPSDLSPSCFWGFPKEYLIFIHKLAGVEVEEDTTKTISKVNKKLTKH